jgi:hypothetical protein
VRSVQVHLPYNLGRVDVHFGQSAIACENSGDAWYSKPAIQLRNCVHRFHAMTSP